MKTMKTYRVSIDVTADSEDMAIFVATNKIFSGIKRLDISLKNEFIVELLPDALPKKTGVPMIDRQ